MKIPLSSRLLACCGFVHPGERVADVGCDHGYLGIYLLTKGIASSVIASDIKEGPLKCAIRNSEKFGVRDRMTFYLSNGVQNIPKAFDTLVCAGMGGDTMISILSAALWLKGEQYRLILQCQSKTPMLRQYLQENSWKIEQEIVLRDGRFLYTVMEVTWQPDLPPIAVGAFYYPSTLLHSPTPESIEYYHQVKRKLRISIAGHGQQADQTEVAALAYLESLANNHYFLREEKP